PRHVRRRRMPSLRRWQRDRVPPWHPLCAVAHTTAAATDRSYRGAWLLAYAARYRLNGQEVLEAKITTRPRRTAREQPELILHGGATHQVRSRCLGDHARVSGRYRMRCGRQSAPMVLRMCSSYERQLPSNHRTELSPSNTSMC